MQLRRDPSKGSTSCSRIGWVPWTSSRPASRRTRRQCSKPSATSSSSSLQCRSRTAATSPLKITDAPSVLTTHGNGGGVTSLAQRGAGSAGTRSTGGDTTRTRICRVATPRSGQEGHDEAAGLRATSQKPLSQSERALNDCLFRLSQADQKHKD